MNAEQCIDLQASSARASSPGLTRMTARTPIRVRVGLVSVPTGYRAAQMILFCAYQVGCRWLIGSERRTRRSATGARVPGGMR